MKEVGIDISNQTSDKIDLAILNHADLVVTLCDHAKDVCPVTPRTSAQNIGDLKILLVRTGQSFNACATKSVHGLNCSVKRANRRTCHLMTGLFLCSGV